MTTAYAAEMVADLHAFDSIDAHAPGLSVSGVGHCRSHAVLDLLGSAKDEGGSKLAAIRGTALHLAWQKARSAARPWLEHEVKVQVAGLSGSCDEYDPETGWVTDLKTAPTDKIAVLAHDGPSLQQQFQVALYALGITQAGRSVAGVRIVWWPVDGTEADVLVWECVEWSPLAEQAVAWLHEVRQVAGGLTLDALEMSDLNGLRDKPYFWCSGWCGHMSACRGGQSEADELLPSLEVAAAAYHEADLAEKAAKARKQEWRPHLLGQNGVTGSFKVSTTGGRGTTEFVTDVDELVAWWGLSRDVPVSGETKETTTRVALTVKPVSK